MVLLDHCSHYKPTSGLLANSGHQAFGDQSVNGGLTLLWRQANLISKG
jgi:hypothetical protein